MSGWGARQFHDLQLALGAFDDNEVARLVALFVDDIVTRPDAVDPRTGLDVLKLLQRKRCISLVQDVAEALLAHGRDSVVLTHRYALALVDHNRTAA